MFPMVGIMLQNMKCQRALGECVVCRALRNDHSYVSMACHRTRSFLFFAIILIGTVVASMYVTLSFFIHI